LRIYINKKLLWIFIPLIFVLIIVLDNYQERYIPPDISINSKNFVDKSGVIHIHTVYSDGSGTFKELSEVAKKVKADFLIISDHNTWKAYYDGKERYYDGTLILIGMELSSPVGHLLILPEDTIITNLRVDTLFKYLINYSSQALIYLAHPFHPKNPVTNWNFGRYNGLELVNGDSEWRNDNVLELVEALGGAIFFSSYLNILMDTPERALNIWDKLLESRKVFIIGSTDAHANIKISDNRKIKFPSYYSSFKMIRTHLLINEDFTGDLATDRNLVLNSLKNGRCYVGIDGYCNTRGFSFYAVKENRFFYMGDNVKIDSFINFVVLSPDTSDVRIKLLKNGKIVKMAEKGKLTYKTDEPGNYRVEIYQLRRVFPFIRKKERPWIYSNPIFVIKD